jgi:hypothetical protein
MLKLSRYERKVARDASLRPKGKVYQTHCHVCICTKRWLCKLDHGLPKSGKAVLCVQCAEKKRAIEAELNSGQQMQINFEPEHAPEYAQYSGFMTFIQNLSGPSVLYWVDQPWVSYKVMYNVHKGSPAKKISAEIGSKQAKSLLQDPVKMTSKVPFYDEMSGDPLYPIPVDSPKPIEVKGLAKKKFKIYTRR